MLIRPDTKIRDAIRAHPELKGLLIALDPRFKKLNNRAVFATVGRWARIRDVARMGDMSLCVLLHTLNTAIGEDDALVDSFPDCLDPAGPGSREPHPDWWASLQDVEERDVRERDDFFFPELERLMRALEPGAALRVINGFEPVPLIRVGEGAGLLHFTERAGPDEVHITFYRPVHPSAVASEAGGADDPESVPELDDPEIMDVRRMKEDPFEIIMKRAQATAPGV